MEVTCLQASGHINSLSDLLDRALMFCTFAVFILVSYTVFINVCNLNSYTVLHSRIQWWIIYFVKLKAKFFITYYVFVVILFSLPWYKFLCLPWWYYWLKGIKGCGISVVTSGVTFIPNLMTVSWFRRWMEGHPDRQCGNGLYFFIFRKESGLIKAVIVKLWYFRLPLWCSCGLCSSGLLCSVGWWLVTDVLRPFNVGPIAYRLSQIIGNQPPTNAM
jgi:hypothetical protein